MKLFSKPVTGVTLGQLILAQAITDISVGAVVGLARFGMKHLQRHQQQKLYKEGKEAK